MTRRRSRSDRGAAAVEFALVVPLLLMLVLGIAEFGRAFYIHATMAGAAREGVRAMALADPATGGPTAGKTAAQTALGFTGPVFTTVACPLVNPLPPATPPNATFTITYNMPLITKMFATKVFHTTKIPLTAKGVMRCNG